MDRQTVPTPQGQRDMPLLPVHAYRSFTILAPVATHFRPASCEEVRCERFLNGWVSRFDERTQLGQGQAYYVRHDSGRRFREERESSGLTVFRFEPGQRCFASADHKVSLERPEIYIARGGDWRGNPTGEKYRHAGSADWVDDFAENQDRIARIIARG